MKVTENVYQVGGAGVTDAADCMVYLLDGIPSILIDAGAGPSAEDILNLIEEVGCARDSLGYLCLTHCHIDHIGGARFFKETCPTIKLIAHQDDLEAITTADPVRTAADWYGVPLRPLDMDVVMEGKRLIIKADPYPLTLMHTPGHTPGSVVGIVDVKGTRILFGQDIHGPFMEAFHSDISQWRHSVEELLGLKADILCEGHYGIFHGKEAVRSFITRQLKVQGF